jgi:hypothetical protein
MRIAGLFLNPYWLPVNSPEGPRNRADSKEAECADETSPETLSGGKKKARFTKKACRKSISPARKTRSGTVPQTVSDVHGN